MKFTLKQMDDDFAKYTNRHGFTSPDTAHAGLFHTFRLYSELKHGLLTEERKIFHRRLYRQLMWDDVAPGVLMPFPKNPGYKPSGATNWTSFDVLAGVLFADKILNLGFSEKFIKWGEGNLYNWNPKGVYYGTPKKMSLAGTYWRFPVLGQAYLIASQRGSIRPNPYFHTYLCNHVLAASRVGFHKRVEKITVHMFWVASMEGYGPYEDELVRRWREKKTSKDAFPGGLGQVLKRYGKVWRESPYIQYCWGLI